MDPGAGEGGGPRSGIKAWFSALNGPRKVAAVIVTIAGGVVTVGTAISMISGRVTGILSFLNPSPSPEGSIQLSKLKVESNDVTLGQYLSWPNVPAQDQRLKLSEEDRQRLGSVIDFDLNVKGFEDRTVYLKWTVFYANPMRTVDGLTKQPAWPSNQAQPQRRSSKRKFQTWVPFPRNDKGTFLVSLEADVHDPDNGKLVPYDSEEVKVRTPDEEPASSPGPRPTAASDQNPAKSLRPWSSAMPAYPTTGPTTTTGPPATTTPTTTDNS